MYRMPRDPVRYAVCCSSRIDRFAPECIVFGGPLIKLALTLGKPAMQIGDNLVGMANVLSGVLLVCGPHRTVIPSANHTLIRARLHEVLSPERISNPRIESAPFWGTGGLCNSTPSSCPATARCSTRCTPSSASPTSRRAGAGRCVCSIRN